MYKLKNISKTYINGEKNSVYVLDEITITLPEKGFVSILGKSGSGKSTMLNILGLLEAPSKGILSIDGTIIDFTKDKQKNSFRRDYISFVFQDYNLLNDLSVLDNLRIASNMNSKGVYELLKIVGIESVVDTEVKYLSGGEKQRLAIARALVRDSKILLLDEPTGNLDEENSIIIFRIIKKIAETRLVLLVSHDVENVQRFADIIYEIEQGKLILKEFSNFDEKLRLTVKKELDTPFYEAFSAINRNKDLEKVTIKSTSKREYTIHPGKKDLFTEFARIVLQEKGYELTIDIIKERNKEVKTELKKYQSEKKQGLEFSFILKYAMKLIFKHKIRLIARVTLMVLALSLVFVQTNVLLTDTDKIISRALDESGQVLVPIETKIVNENTLQEHLLQRGKYSFTIYKDAFGSERFVHSYKTLPIVQRADLDANPFNEFFINVVIEDEGNKAFSQMLDIIGRYPAVAGEILLSDFMAYYIFGTVNAVGKSFYVFRNDSIFFDINNEVTYKVSGIIQTGFKENEVFYRFLNNAEYYARNFDDFKLKYSIALITTETYIKHARMQVMSLAGSDFTRTSLNTFDYAHPNFSLNYKLYESQTLLLGRQPTKKNEVVVSTSFLDLVSLDQSVVGQTFSYKDVNASPNWSNFQGVINIYDIVNEITIVGVTDEEEASIFIHEYFFQALMDESFYNLQFYYVINAESDLLNVVDVIHQNNGFIILEFLRPIYMFKFLLESSFYNVLIAMQVIFSLIATLVLWMMTKTSINHKLKEIGIMKSMGIKNRNIMSIFLVQNGVFSLLATAISIGVSAIALYLLNTILVGEDLFGSGYKLIHVNIASYLLLIAIIILINAVATISPFIRINNLDVSLTIKDANS